MICVLGDLLLGIHEDDLHDGGVPFLVWVETTTHARICFVMEDDEKMSLLVSWRFKYNYHFSARKKGSESVRGNQKMVCVVMVW